MASLKTWSAAATAMALGLLVRHRTRTQRKRLRPRVTPLGLIHPDELVDPERVRKLAS